MCSPRTPCLRAHPALRVGVLGLGLAQQQSRVFAGTLAPAHPPQVQLGGCGGVGEPMEVTVTQIPLLPTWPASPHGLCPMSTGAR